MLVATIKVIDNNISVNFDAQKWFETADADDILSLAANNWRTDTDIEPISRLAQNLPPLKMMDMELHGQEAEEVKAIMRYWIMSQQQNRPIVCEISIVEPDQATNWLARYRPDVDQDKVAPAQAVMNF